MCNMCYGFIYDTIVNPYHKTDPLSKAVYLTHEEVHRVTETFLEVISKFRDLYFFEDANNIPLNKCDEWTWIKFEIENPDDHAKIEREVENTLESMKQKKKHVTEELVTRFFMNKFRILMMLLPQLHLDHTFKICPREKSLGPVPYSELVEIKKKAGLPIPEYKENFEDLYN